MPILYPVDHGTIVLCDFDKGGFRPPEMVKRRPVVVLVGRLPMRHRLATVVPLSGTAAPAGCDYQCRIMLESPLPAPFHDHLDWWVKADMIASVSYDRLDLFRTARDQLGRRQYVHPRVGPEHMATIRRTILKALRFPD